MGAFFFAAISEVWKYIDGYHGYAQGVRYAREMEPMEETSSLYTAPQLGKQQVRDMIWTVIIVTNDDSVHTNVVVDNNARMLALRYHRVQFAGGELAPHQLLVQSESFC